MARKKITYDSHFKGHPIQANKEKNQGCIVNIVEGYHDRLEYMKKKHAQVSVMQFVVTIPADVDPAQAGKIAGYTLECLKKTKNNEKVDMQYGWVLERTEKQDATDESHGAHLHIGFINDGSKIQSAVGIAEDLDRLQAKKTGKTGRVHYCVPNSVKYDKQATSKAESATAIKIRRDQPGADEQTGNALNWLSYTAKTRQKGNASCRQREFGFSRLPKDDKKQS